MAFAGLRGTGDFGVDERPKNFREMILWRNPNGSAPLTALMSKMKTEKTDDPEFAWWEEEQNAVRVQISGIQLAASGDWELVSGGLSLVPGDLLLVSQPTQTEGYTNEIVEVVTIVDDTNIDVRVRAAQSLLVPQRWIRWTWITRPRLVTYTRKVVTHLT